MTAQPDGELAATFRRLIANTGPISLMHYMGESNARYYASRDPLGRHGDFVTAPEISQMFGELIGLWLADMWIKAGRPQPIHYVELGPGRGTLAKDALRTAKRYGLEPRLHFVEPSPALKDIQLRSIPGVNAHADLSTVPIDAPILLVANEFLDALPIRQLVRLDTGWRERMVGLEGDRLVPVYGSQPMDSAIPEQRRDAPTGAIIETCPAAATIMFEVAGRLVSQGGAALFIDYGYASHQTGSTLQAVKHHRKVDPFAMPGEADLTALVDFVTMAAIAESRGARWLGTVTQGDFLRELGIEMRTEALAKQAPQHREDLIIARDRLVDPEQMGDLFKVMGLAGPTWPDGAGFES